MNKCYFFCLMLASLAIITSCQKEKEFVTLDAVIDQSSKVYINQDRYPCWNDGDQVFINNQAYGVDNVDGTYAHIAHVTVNEDYGYHAVYPAGIVTSTNICGENTSVSVTLPYNQLYRTDDANQYQRVELPMAAYTQYNATRNTLHFHNLCSIVRVTVENDLPDNGTMAIQEISIVSENTPLSGTGAITNDGTNEYISIANNENNHKYVSLSCENPNNAMKTLTTTGQKDSFDIVLPQFGSASKDGTRDNITITVKCSTGYKVFYANGVYLNHNSIVPIQLQVNSLAPLRAVLTEGRFFKNQIPESATSVRFDYGSNATSSTWLQDPSSPTRIYGYMDGNTWVVATAAESIIANERSDQMFSGKSNLTSISFGDNFITDDVTTMEQMFKECSGLTSLDLSNLNTSSVTNMKHMFNGCSSLTSITFTPAVLEAGAIAPFTTQNVTNMEGMFQGCRALSTLDLSNFSTTGVTTMRDMFQDCRSMTSLDLSSFSTTNVTDSYGMYRMFAGCYALTSLDISSFNTANVKSMEFMFDDCQSITSITFPTTFTTASVKNMHGMFRRCWALTSLDLGNFTINSSLTNMSEMFKDCNSLTSLDLHTFNTANVTNMKAMFSGCNKISTLTLGLNFSMTGISVDDYFSQMFSNLASNTNPLGCNVYCSSSVQAFFDFDDNHSNYANAGLPNATLPNGNHYVQFSIYSPSTSK